MNTNMNARLIVVVGPSGAGKDSLLAWLRARLPARHSVHWVRRTITRPAQAGGEDHESLDDAVFDAAVQAGCFALHWQANGLHYGIRRSELLPLAQGQWVMLNGSRAHLPDCAQVYPGLTVLHIVADTEVLRMRLLNRGRESEEVIEERLKRAVKFEVPESSHLLEVHNSGSLDEAGDRLLSLLERLFGSSVLGRN